MPTTKMPVWIRSEYVIIGQPPFREDQGARSCPLHWGANRLPYWQRQGYDTTERQTAQEKREAVSRLGGGFFVCPACPAAHPGGAARQKPLLRFGAGCGRIKGKKRAAARPRGSPPRPRRRANEMAGRAAAGEGDGR